MFDAEGRFVTALLRPSKRPSGVEIGGFVRRLIGALRHHWPKVEILLRVDSHYACPEVFDWCRKNRVDWIFGRAANAALRRHVAGLGKNTAERFRTARETSSRRAKAIIERAEQAELTGSSKGKGLSRRLRSSVPGTFARLHIVPKLMLLLSTHPAL